MMCYLHLLLLLLHVTLEGVNIFYTVYDMNQRVARLRACSCVIMQVVSVLQCRLCSHGAIGRLIAMTGMKPEPVCQKQARVRFHESVYLFDTVDSALLWFVRPELNSSDKTTQRVCRAGLLRCVCLINVSLQSSSEVSLYLSPVLSWW